MTARGQSEDASPATPAPGSDGLSTDHLQADLKGRTIRGGAVTVFAQGAQFTLQMLCTVVLARLLTPADFGLIAMVNVLTVFAHMFSEGGLAIATIQRKEINQQQVTALFWVNVVIGVVIMLAVAATAPVLTWFYREPRLVGITYLAATAFFFIGLGVQHDALLRRQMRFVAMATRNVAAAAVAVGVGIAMGWLGAGYWALVTYPVVGSVTRTVLSWLMVDWRPGRPRRAKDVRSMLMLGGNQTAANCVIHVSTSLDSLLIGRFWGAGPLGLYAKAQALLLLPFRQLDGPLTAVALPALSRIQDDPERLAHYYLRLTNLLMWATTPLVGLLFVAAQPVIVLVLGDQWRESAAVFRIFAALAPAFPLLQVNVLLFQCRGQTDRLLKLTLLRAPVLMGSVAAGLPFGIRGVALAYTAANLATLPWVFAYTFSGTRLTLGRLGRALLYPIAVCLDAVVSGLAVLETLAPDGDLLPLLVTVATFALVYGLGVLVPAVRRELVTLRDLLRELRPPRSR